MNNWLRQLKPALPWVALLAGVSVVPACTQAPSDVQVSEQPETLQQQEDIKTAPREGRFSLRSRIAYADIETLIESELPARHTVKDSRRLCKRIIGIKACGTANWILNVTRHGEFKVKGDKQHIIVQAPIAFDGIVGMDGKVANALGLSNLDVKGSVIADIILGLQVKENWCPQISVSVTYDWSEKPTVVWQNKLDFSLEKIINGALDKQLEQLEPRINASIDCNAFRKQLEKQWKNYSFAIDLPTVEGANEVDKMHLNFIPTGFAFSGLHTELDKLGLGFALDGTTVLESEPAQISSLTLPPLKHIEYQQSKTDFDLLLRATYSQLEKVLKPKLLGKTYISDSIAGEASVTINSIALSSNATGVTVGLGFTAQLPGTSRDTKGTVFLLANPEIDAEKEQLSLNDIRLTKVIDSTVWNLLSTVFESQIIGAIKRNAIINYAPRLRELEQKIIEQLQDSSRTGGVVVTTKQLSIRLLDIIPEASSLAALARVSADWDIDVPVSLIQKTTR